jgi:hypothetical protein
LPQCRGGIKRVMVWLWAAIYTQRDVCFVKKNAKGVR